MGLVKLINKLVNIGRSTYIYAVRKLEMGMRHKILLDPFKKNKFFTLLHIYPLPKM